MTSLVKKFNVLFLLSVALPILAVNVALSYSYLNAIFQVVAAQTAELNQQIAYNIGKEIDSVSIVAASLIYDTELRSAALRFARPTGGPDSTAAGIAINDRLSSIFLYSNLKGGATVHFPNGRTISFGNMANLDIASLYDSDFVSRVKNERGNVLVADSVGGIARDSDSEFMVTAMISPPDGDSASGFDYIVVSVSIPYLQQVLNVTSEESGWSLYILGADSRVLLARPTLNEAVTQLRGLKPGDGQLGTVSLGGKQVLLVSKRLDSSGWRIYSGFAREKLSGKINAYFWYIFPALGVVLCLFLLYSHFFLSRIAQPIKSIIASMNEVARGDDTVFINYQGIREFHELVDNFNRMVEEIRQLNRDRELKERLRLQSEVAALQFQINPHFVVNTLNSIRLMAQASKSLAIREMLQALIQILRDSYAPADSLTPLRGEIANLKSYIYIMKVRFGESLDVEFDIAEESLDLLVLRLMLQPIVENAILHGIVASERKGLIRVSAFRESASRGLVPDESSARQSAPDVSADSLILLVEDNGRGMSAQTLAQTLTHSGSPDKGENSFNRVGIRNVRDRIKLNFGEAYGLEIESEPDRGTRVKFILPVRLGEKVHV